MFMIVFVISSYLISAFVHLCSNLTWKVSLISLNWNYCYVLDLFEITKNVQLPKLNLATLRCLEGLRTFRPSV